MMGRNKYLDCFCCWDNTFKHYIMVKYLSVSLSNQSMKYNVQLYFEHLLCLMFFLHFFFSLHSVANKDRLIKYVDKVMYLGVFSTTGRQLFKLSFREPSHKFHKSFNDILYRSKGHMDEIILMMLFHSLFRYALDAVSQTDSK